MPCHRTAATKYYAQRVYYEKRTDMHSLRSAASTCSSTDQRFGSLQHSAHAPTRHRSSTSNLHSTWTALNESRINSACFSDRGANLALNGYGVLTQPGVQHAFSFAKSGTTGCPVAGSRGAEKSIPHTIREIAMKRDACATWLPAQNRRPQPNE